MHRQQAETQTRKKNGVRAAYFSTAIRSESKSVKLEKKAAVNSLNQEKNIIYFQFSQRSTSHSELSAVDAKTETPWSCIGDKLNC